MIVREDVRTLAVPAPPAALRLGTVDRAGMLLSSLCLVHCLALPLIVALLPALGAVLPGDFAVHLVLILLAFPVTGFALWRGARLHGDRVPLLVGLAGLGLVAAALPVTRFAILEAALTVGGGMLVVSAHLRNWRAHRAACARPSHGHG